jgi:transcriptional regulator with XRE-family HTH domain
MNMSRVYTYITKSCKIIPMNTFKDFIEKKYVQWQNEQGKRKTIADFAAFLGISQPLLSMWMSGSKKPGKENAKILFEIYGDEVSKALGQDTDLFFITANWDNFDDDARRELREIAENSKKRNITNEVLRSSKKRKSQTAD